MAQPLDPASGASGAAGHSHPWPFTDDVALKAELLSSPQAPAWPVLTSWMTHVVRSGHPPPGQEEEIVQEAFLRVTASLPTFRGDSRLSTWLITIIAHLILDAWRRVQRERGQFSLDAALQAAIDGDPNDDSRRESAWPLHLSASRTTEQQCVVREELRAAILGLLDFAASRAHAERNRALLLQALLDDLPPEMVAQRLGVSRQVVDNVIFQARQYLRAKATVTDPAPQAPSDETPNGPSNGHSYGGKR